MPFIFYVYSTRTFRVICCKFLQIHLFQIRKDFLLQSYQTIGFCLSQQSDYIFFRYRLYVLTRQQYYTVLPTVCIIKACCWCRSFKLEIQLTSTKLIPQDSQLKKSYSTDLTFYCQSNSIYLYLFFATLLFLKRKCI